MIADKVVVMENKEKCFDRVNFYSIRYEDRVRWENNYDMCKDGCVVKRFCISFEL